MSLMKLILVCIGWLLTLSLSGQNINKHKWKNRILIINTSTEKSNLLHKQIEELSQNHIGFKERKLVLYIIKADEYKFTNFHDMKEDSTWKKIKEIDRDIMMTNNTFKIRLIGLDGDIKLEKTEFLKQKNLFDLIDAMPMRVQELRN